MKYVFLDTMEGVIINFRRSRKTTDTNQMVVKTSGVDKRDKASKLVGKKVVYNTGKTDINGQITSAHGNSGALLVRFEKGMPGQAIGKKVSIN